MDVRWEAMEFHGVLLPLPGAPPRTPAAAAALAAAQAAFTEADWARWEAAKKASAKQWQEMWAMYLNDDVEKKHDEWTKRCEDMLRQRREQRAAEGPGYWF